MLPPTPAGVANSFPVSVISALSWGAASQRRSGGKPSVSSGELVGGGAVGPVWTGGGLPELGRSSPHATTATASAQDIERQRMRVFMISLCRLAAVVHAERGERRRHGTAGLQLDVDADPGLRQLPRSGRIVQEVP